MHVHAGRLAAADLDVFEADVIRAWTIGLDRGLSGQRRRLRSETLEKYSATYLEFPRLRPEGSRDVFVFVSQDYPSDTMGGVERSIRAVARSVAKLGHHVHVLTGSSTHDSLDFEQGVWVHRITPRFPPPPPRVQTVPSALWTHAWTMSDELRNLAKRCRVTAVYAPLWDCEIAAILGNGEWPVVTGLEIGRRKYEANHTSQSEAETLARWLRSARANWELSRNEPARPYH